MPRGVSIILLLATSALLASAPVAATHDDHLRDEWPTAQGDFARTGVRGHVEGPGTGATIWRFMPGSLDIESPPAVAGGVVYFGDSDGWLHALEARTGERLWAFQTGDQVRTGAVVADGRVYVANFAGRLHALDAASGEPVWSFEGVGDVRAAPTIADGVVYFGTMEGVLYAVDAASGREVWSFEAGKSIESSPLVRDGAVVFGSYDQHIYALDAADGSIRWKIRVRPPVDTSAAADGHKIYISSEWRDLYAVDPANGRIVWTQETGFSLGSSPSVRDGVVYQVSSTGLYALSAETGEIRWQFSGTRGGGKFVAVSEHAVYLAHGSGTIFALSLDEGDVLWRRDIASFIVSSPVVVDGVLYVGTGNFFIWALDAGAGLDPMPSATQVPARPGSGERGTPGTEVVLVLLVLVLGSIGRRREPPRVR